MPFGISFIIPAFNEELFIGRCLESIRTQISKSPIPAEIIVVDNNSRDNTVAIAKQFTPLVFSNSTKGNPSITRNLGAQKAIYDILCFVDGDCLLADDWISRIVSVFSTKEIGAYGGPILSPTNGNWVERAWAPTETPQFKKYNVILAGANFAIRKALFESLNGFNEHLISAEDDDLSKRTIASGLKICYDSNHYVIHLGYPRSLTSVLKKQIWHGSTQLRAHGLLGDKVVVLTLLYLLSIAACAFSLIAFNAWLTSGIGSLLLIFPGVLAYGRSRKFIRRSASLYIKLYLISSFFLAGRSIGLIKELTRKLGLVG